MHGKKGISHGSKTYGPMGRKLIKFGLDPDKAFSVGSLSVTSGNRAVYTGKKRLCRTPGQGRCNTDAIRTLALSGQPSSEAGKI